MEPGPFLIGENRLKKPPRPFRPPCVSWHEQSTHFGRRGKAPVAETRAWRSKLHVRRGRLRLTAGPFVTKCRGNCKIEREERLMVQITPKAEEVLKQYFQDKEVSPIRIFLQQGG